MQSDDSQKKKARAGSSFHSCINGNGRLSKFPSEKNSSTGGTQQVNLIKVQQRHHIDV